MEEQNTPHKRRVRYAGKYPRRFEEKYKELAPERYEGIAEHIQEKGGTPAGMHISIMVKEVLETLKIRPGERGLDCTLGYGGHSRRMLEQLQGEGFLCSLDIDPIESVKTEKRLRELGFGPELWQLRHINFADIDQAAAEFGGFDFILADLGVSSMQIDDPSRGFSYKTEGPLDLRMNPERGKSAAELLRSLSAGELEAILIENSDEPYASDIAKAIREALRRGPVETTTELRRVIEKVLTERSLKKIPEKDQKDQIKKCLARVFQALRIEVNQEYAVLERLLQKLPAVLNPGGRVVFLTFHSGEDRLVKQYFKEGQRDGSYSEVSRDVLRPSAEECRRNPRAHSTKLRYAVKA